MSNIAKFRKKAGLTQTELSLKVGVTESIVKKWEGGQRSPRLYRLKVLAKVLRCKAADLLD